MSEIDDLRHIRAIMEKSSKFRSISGLSCILAGIFALVGAAFVYQIVYKQSFTILGDATLDVWFIAGGVLVASGFFGLFLSYKKSKRLDESIWSSVSKQLFKDAFIPLFVGGVFSLILVYHHLSYLVASVMLLTCGLAAINAGAKSFRDLKFLGSTLIFLGFLAAFFYNYGLLFWTIGFGVCFIVYGLFIHLKYEINQNKTAL